MTRWSVTFAAALFFALGSNCGATELKLGIVTPTPTLDPYYFDLPQFSAVNAAIYDPIVHMRDGDAAPEPWLAESWKLIDDTTWEFQLRPNVKFHDGASLTAADVAFSFMRAKAALSPQGFGPRMRAIKDVQVLDDLHLRVLTNGPAPALLDALATVGILEKAKADGATPEDFNSGKAAIGTGPYKFSSFSPNDKLVGDRFDGYWRGALPFDRVSYIGFPADASRMAAVLSGDIDVAEGAPPQDIEHLKSNPKVSIASVLSNRMIYLSLDTGSEALDTGKVTGPNGEKLQSNPLADARVREAMKLAINLDGIVSHIYQGQAKAFGQFFIPGNFSYVPDLKPWVADEAKARTLVADSGWANKFKLVLSVPGTFFPNAIPSAEAIAQSWTRIGIPTSVDNMPYPVFSQNRQARKLPVFIHSNNVFGEKGESLFTGNLHSRDPAHGLGTLNFHGYANPKVDQLIEETFSTMDVERQKATRQEAMRLIINDGILLPLWHTVNATAVRAGLDFTPRPDFMIYPTSVRPKP